MERKSNRVVLAAWSQLVNAVRNGPYWKDTIIFITYDEHGGAPDQ